MLALTVSLLIGGLPGAAPGALRDPSALRADVATIAQPTREGRTSAVVALIRKAGFVPEIETFDGGNVRRGPIAGRNVSFVVNPPSTSRAREILLVAHYDAAYLPDNGLSQGLVDNGASVVAMIEAARLMRADYAGARLKHRVRVLFTDQEELDLVGAKQWIVRHGIANLDAVINADVAAYGHTIMYGENNGAPGRPLNRAIAQLCVDCAVDCVAFPVYPSSDDRAFYRAGAPVLSLGYQDAIGARQFWLMFNGGDAAGLPADFRHKIYRTIHTPGDRLDEVDGTTLAESATFYAALVARIDRLRRGPPDRNVYRPARATSFSGERK
ncbi:MAG: M28 family peptidase [Sphingopyxis sp.]|nr:M28 family peptidase [Sphingopyxis sp.]